MQRCGHRPYEKRSRGCGLALMRWSQMLTTIGMVLMLTDAMGMLP